MSPCPETDAIIAEEKLIPQAEARNTRMDQACRLLVDGTAGHTKVLVAE